MRRYGLTEITPVSSTHLEDDIDHILNTVGKPLESLDVKIKDMNTGSFCPAGIQGEIVVKGPYLMNGYLFRRRNCYSRGEVIRINYQNATAYLIRENAGFH